MAAQRTAQQIIKAAHSYLSKRDAAEAFIDNFGQTVVNYDPYGKVLYAHALINWANAFPWKKVTENMHPELIKHFGTVTRDFDTQDRLLLFHYFITTGGLGYGNPEDFTKTVLLISKLPMVREAVEDLAEEHPYLILYRGVSAKDEAQARERLLRPFWTGDYHYAIRLAKRWVSKNKVKGKHHDPLSKQYFGRASINTLDVLVPLAPVYGQLYTYSEFIINTGKLTFDMSEI
jgi:hypothetical protein